MILTTIILATAGAAGAAGAVTPMWLTILTILGVPLFGYLGARLNARYGFLAKKAEISGATEAKIEEVAAQKTKDANDYALNQLDKFANRIDQQDKKIVYQTKRIESLEEKERKSFDYMVKLRQHIADGYPPPPPEWPDFNGSHMATGPNPTV